MQTTVQNEKSIRLGSCICRVDGVNIGALQNAQLAVEVSTLQLKADNAELDPRKKVTAAKITCDSWEINMDSLVKFDGIGDLTATSASPVNVVGEVLKESGSVASGDSLDVEHTNADGSMITAVTLKNGTTTVASADYTLTLVDGKVRLVYTGTGLSINSAGLTLNYTYTPANRKTYTVKDVIKLIETYRVELENTDSDGKKFIIEFPKAYNIKGIDFAFQADDKLDEVMKYPLEFQAKPLPNKELYYIHDEQAV